MIALKESAAARRTLNANQEKKEEKHGQTHKSNLLSDSSKCLFLKLKDVIFLFFILPSSQWDHRMSNMVAK